MRRREAVREKGLKRSLPKAPAGFSAVSGKRLCRKPQQVFGHIQPPALPVAVFFSEAGAKLRRHSAAVGWGMVSLRYSLGDIPITSRNAVENLLAFSYP